MFISNYIITLGVLWEYCAGRSFNPTCAHDQVIIMESAQYGHIRQGRCVDTDLGHFGCATNQLSWLDRQCSGKSSCDIIITDVNFEGELPCTASLARYLETEYICQNGKCRTGYKDVMCAVCMQHSVI